MRKLTALLVASVTACTPAHAGVAYAEEGFTVPLTVARTCADRDALATLLASDFGEYRFAMGVVDGTGNLLETFVSPQTFTWTMIIVAPDGRACILASGDAWEMLPVAHPTAEQRGA